MSNFLRTQLPTLDAGLSRAGGWWQGRSARERMMLAGLGLFLGAMVLIYGVVKPIQGARAAALADIRTYETLNARIRAAGSLSSAKPQRRTGAPEAIATQSAGAFGVALTTAPIPGGVRATVADASYESLVHWLADVTTTSDLRVRRVTLQRLGAPGHVSGTVEFGQ
ncbi:type II secretion system protein GspM [Sphingomonas sp. TDK1]|uniref:type II secretion system protein GspM n=1 Tax=Sphingomonas sp. TDK1 TaxID=453247 RepID=UPI0007D946F8|nr:type II secretion system protein M [Sphingomonas sp. TDK1]OAN57250.1 general secretion pathway protein GspM [Sphingomonas sp. TDK1]